MNTRDLLIDLRAGDPCKPDRLCRVMNAASGCYCAWAADEIEKMRKALLDIHDRASKSLYGGIIAEIAADALERW